MCMYRAVRVKTRKPTFRVPTPDRKFGWVFGNWEIDPTYYPKGTDLPDLEKKPQPLDERPA